MSTKTAYRLQRHFADKGNRIIVVNGKISDGKTGLMVECQDGSYALWFGDITHELYRTISGCIRDTGNY